jgi:DNA-binding CsgD family transcriptional regulator
MAESNENQNSLPQQQSAKTLGREFVTERDVRIFKMRQAGIQHSEIGRRLGISVVQVSNAIRRQLQKLNSEALLAYPEVLRMELERLDSLQQNLWAQTQHRRKTLDDGTEIMEEPDLKAVDRVLSIMDRRARLLGLDKNNVSIQMDVTSAGEQIRSSLSGVQATQSVNAFSPETEARKLIDIMISSGVMSRDVMEQLTGTKLLELTDSTGNQIIDAIEAVESPVEQNDENLQSNQSND